MRLILLILLSFVFLCGCSNTKFYNIGIINAKAVKSNVSIKEISSSNSYFKVYKLNMKNYALLPKMYSRKDIFDEINNAIIFNDEQIIKLRKTCEEIIEYYGDSIENEAKIIEYYLFIDKQNLETRISSSLYNSIATAKINRYNEVVFRIQFIAKQSKDNSINKKVLFKFRTFDGIMTIDDLKSFYKDINM